METQTQKAERKHPDKKPRVLHFTTRLSTCQPKIYNIDRQWAAPGRNRNNVTRIRLRFRGSSLIAAYRVPVSGNPNLARNCQLRPLGFIKGTTIRSLVHLSLSLLEVGARVCQSSCRATSTRTSSGPLPMEPLSATCERSRLSHWYSNPISPSLSAFVCRGSRRTECSILRPGLRDVDKLVGRRENISQGFSFSFFPFEGKGRERGKVENDFRQLWGVEFLKWTFEEWMLVDCCRFLEWERGLIKLG